MGNKRELLGYVVVVKPYRKYGNGAKGGGRLGSTGKRCILFKVDSQTGVNEEVARSEGATAAAAIKDLRAKARIIPGHVAIQHNGQTYF